jgi:hypothetical protein
MKWLILPLAALSVTACASKQERPEPIVQTVEVLVPTPQPCVPKSVSTTPPSYVDTDDALLNAKDGAERYKLVYSGRLQRIGRLGELELVVKSCPREP